MFNLEIESKKGGWDFGWLLLFFYLDICMILLGVDLPKSNSCNAAMIVVFIISAISTFSKEGKTRVFGFSIFFLFQVYLLAIIDPSVGMNPS